MTANVMVWLLAAGVVLASWFYFRRWTLSRPPLGTVNLGDVTFTLACIVILPLLYLWLPGWLVGTLLAITTLSALWFVIEPISRSPLVRWGVAGGLVVADVLLAWLVGTASTPFLPMTAWPVGSGQWAGIGLGDLLMAAVAPLVMRKAFGHAAGIAAISIALVTIAGVLLVTRWDALPETFPTMIVLGPLMVLHYGLWSRRSGAERTWVRYLAEEPLQSVTPG